LLALLNGKAGGQITGADLSRVEDPILGILTGTYTPQQQTGPNLADLSYQYRPTWESLQNDEFYDENSLEMRIASTLANGVPLMEVKKQIPQFLQAEGLPFGPNDTTTQELINFASKLDSENHAYNVAVTKANTDKNDNSWWAKAGISDPSLRADPAAILNPQLERLAKMYKPLTDPSTTGGYRGSGGNYIPGTKLDIDQERIDLRREKADAVKAAEEKLQQKGLPYEAGGVPGFSDLFVGALRRSNQDRTSGTMGGIFDYLTGQSLTKGFGNVAGDMVRRTATNIFRPNEEKALEKKYLQETEQNVGADDDSRERARMLVRREAMGGKSGASKIPVRAAKLNKEAEDKMLRVAAILKERADREAASMPTPAQSDIMNRILSIAMAERLKR